MSAVLPTFEGRTLPAFPCSREKRPVTPHGFKDATADPARFADLCRRYPGPLIGVATGDASGIDVLDVDPVGTGWLAGYEQYLPATRRHQTRRGTHILFRHEPDLRCSIGRVAAGVDVKADGGYVIWWPSAGFEVNGARIANWPSFLLELATTRTFWGENGHLPAPKGTEIPAPSSIAEVTTYFFRFVQTAPRFSREETFGKFAMRHAELRVAATPVGRRNHVLNGEGLALGRLLVRGWISGLDAVSRLWFGALACGYVRDHGEAATVAAIRHALSDGMGRPYPDLAVVDGKNDAA